MPFQPVDFSTGSTTDKVVIINIWRQSGSYSECVMRKLLTSL